MYLHIMYDTLDDPFTKTIVMEHETWVDNLIEQYALGTTWTLGDDGHVDSQ